MTIGAPGRDETAAHDRDVAGRRRRHWMSGLRRSGGGPLHLAIAIPLLSGIVLVGQAMLLARILHQAVGGGATLAQTGPMVAALGGAMALRALLAFAGERAGVAGAERIKLALRDALLRTLLAHRPGWTAQRASGSLAGALVDQIETLDGFFARFLPAMVAASLLPLAFAAVVLPIDWVVGLLLLVTIPLVPLFMALIGWGAEAASDAQASALSRLSAAFADRLRGLSTLVNFGRAEAEAEAMAGVGEEWRRRTMKVLRIAVLSSAVLEFFAALGVAGVALYVGLSFLGLVNLRGDPLTLEAGLLCLLMAPEVYAPLRLLAAHYHDRAGAIAAIAEIERQFGALPDLRAADAAHRDREAPAARSRAADPAAPFSVAVSELRLATPDGTRSLLDHASLLLPAGRHVALLGPSGSGKTSLLETLARLREAHGTILFGNDPLVDLDEGDLRTRVAFLSQRPRIFRGTIAENIRLGRPDAGEDDLRRAAETAAVADFADRLPKGLHSLVGEDGLGLSGGEAHRVGLARLYLRDPALILLDEPTAHLDPETEDRVLSGLLAFAKGRSLFVATHSDRLACRMDLVLHIENRRLVPEHGRLARPMALLRENAA